MALLALRTAVLLCLAWFARGQQPPRRVGMQAFQLMDSLWLDGGRFLYPNGSVVQADPPPLVSYNTLLDFRIDSGPVVHIHRRDSNAPIVYHGFMFSNLVDRAWLFGGKPVGQSQSSISNDIWRFELRDDGEREISWTRVPLGESMLQGRPYRGAGRNIPDLKRGYYLGGMTDQNDSDNTSRYLHWLFEFNMETETVAVHPVPDYVPVVNQSLVFLDTGSRSGALVALGGFTERGGILSKVPLTSVFIFDIESGEWAQQPVTGWDGNLDEDGTYDVAPPNGGIPRSRMAGCAAAGSAQDKTSHNIVILGGANETSSLPDAWILSLPSAIWIKARLMDGASSPKIENSCILTNDRFIWMFGGCFALPRGMPCMGYSYDPLVYDMSLLKIEHYVAHVDGFLVHENVSNIIGGSATGNATKRAPMFANLSSPILQELFNPPFSKQYNSTTTPFQYDDYALRYIIAFLAVPTAVALFVPFLGMDPFRKLFVFAGPKAWRIWTPSLGSWRPSVFGLGFLFFLTLTTACLMALVTTLAYVSQIDDPNPERWTGGLDSDGTWTGIRWKSKFIRQPTLSRPPQGLISFYQDKEPDGVWSQKNSTQRLGNSIYWAFTYLPTLVAVLYGRLWKVLDDEVKRIDKFVQLQRPGGARAKDSIFLDYHSFWVPLSIFQALRRRHWCVAISSLGLTLGSIVAPVVQNYTFSWTLYSGAHLPWPDTYSWLVALVDPWWSKVLTGILASCLACSVLLLLTLPRQETGLHEDPKGLSSIVYMIPKGSAIFHKASNGQTRTQIEESLGNLHLQLVHEPNHPTPILELATPPNPSPNPPTRHTRIKPTKIIKTCLAHIKTRLSHVQPPKPISTLFTTFTNLGRVLHTYLVSSPLSLLLRPPIFTLYLLSLFALLALLCTISTAISRNAKDRLWNYSIPFPTNLYLILAVLAQSVADVLDFSLRVLWPFYALRTGSQPAAVLFDGGSYESVGVVPVVEMARAFLAGHSAVGWAMAASTATAVLTIFLGALQLSSSYYGATTFESDLVAATVAAWLVGFVLVVYAAVGWKVTRRLGGGMKRFVDTVGVVAPYVVFSPGLREDLDRVRGLGRSEERVRELDRLRRRYGLGVWKEGRVGMEMFGVERQYDDGGSVDVERVL